MSNGITDPSQKYFKDSLWTFDGSVWRPQAQLLGYRDVIRAVSTTSATLGTNTINFAAMATGYVGVIESIFAYNLTTAASSIAAYVVASGTAYMLHYTFWDTTKQVISVKTQIVLAPGENIRIVFFACVAADALNAYLIGRKFPVAE